MKRIDAETGILILATSEDRQQRFQLTDQNRPGGGLKQWISHLNEGTLDCDSSPPTALEVHIRDRG